MTENHYSFVLPSNSGWCETFWKLNDVVEVENRRLFSAKVEFRSKFWNQTKFMQKNNFNSSDLVEDCFLTLPQLLLVEQELEKLLTYLANWLQTPINQILETPLNYVADLTAFIDYQFFEMKFGITGERIVPRGQTECTISYEASGISGKISYIIDQTCIRIFAESLEEQLSNRRQV